MPKTDKRIRHFVLTALVCVLCVGCASAPTSSDGSKIERSSADPWEPLNRAMYESNGFLDRVTFKPMAKVYATIVPKFIRRGIRNFSLNLRAPLNIINNFLQGKAEGFRQTGRFIINSTVGIGGFIDVATVAGIDVQREDFGQTLAVWGVPDGPYVFIPILGPLTLRDAVMVPLNLLADPLVYYKDTSVRDKVYLVRAIDFRELVLSTADAQIKGAYDPYIRVREAYLQNRQFLIYDGDPPEDDDFDEFFDDELEDESLEEE